MTVESLRAFGRKVQVDAQLRERLSHAQAVASAKIAADAGFTFTTEEAQAAINEVYAELSEEQLEAVAGGLLGLPFATVKGLSK